MEPNNSDWPQVMDLKTAAKYLGFHPVTLRDWKRKGEGPPGRKVGGHWRFLKSAVDAYLGAETKESALQARNPTSRARPDVPNPRVEQEYLKALGLAVTGKRDSKNRPPLRHQRRTGH